METLPAEIIWQILDWLRPLDIVKLQLVCRRLASLARDNNVWRDQCFEGSTYLENLRKWRERIASAPPPFQDLESVVVESQVATESAANEYALPTLKAGSKERTRMLANWDPSYPTEKIDWYSEYIQRKAPITTSFLQQPRRREGADREYLEIRGVGTYTPHGTTDAKLAIAPLDDGSVCLWDVEPLSGTKGRIVGRSKSDTLSLTRPSGTPDDSRLRMISTGVTDCVTIDSYNKKAFIAVQSGLIEIDLETLQAVSEERYPFSISALSEANGITPITVGTNLSLHLHDSRFSHRYPQECEAVSVVETPSQGLRAPKASGFRGFFQPHQNEKAANYAPLFRPGPLSILHLASSGDSWNGNGDIYVAGRFPSILNYDRRHFPKLRGTIHSGARLCGLSSMPYPYGAQQSDAMRHGDLSVEEVHEIKSLPGSTLLACGEYNSKGSLELYGLSPLPDLSTISTNISPSAAHNAVLKNRQTSSNSKILSITTHGTRIVFSDGSGNVKWVERDGITDVRCTSITQQTAENVRGIFGVMGDSSTTAGSGDIVRKLLPLAKDTERRPNRSELLAWTGEKLGLLTFSNKPGFTEDDFEEKYMTEEEARRTKDEQDYADTMRRALERQADEVRFVRGLGLGLDFNLS